MRKSALAGAGIAAVLGLTLSACSSTPEDSPSSSAPGEQPAEQVTITYSNFISNGGNEDNLAKIVAAFEAENPDIKVEVTTLPYADYFDALKTDLVAGTTADVFDIEYATYPQFQPAGVFAPLEGVDTSVYRGDIAAAYATDGVQYALPTSFSTVVLFYNKDLFDAAGVDYPTSDWTWADEMAAAEKLTDAANGVWGDYQPISYYEYYKALVQAGGSFLSADGKSVAFNSPEGLAAAEHLVKKAGTVMPTAEQGAGTPDFDTNLWATGKLAMWHTGIWMFGAGADGGFDWDIVVEPGSAQKGSAVFSNAVAVSANSQHKEAAQKFAEFLSSSSVMVDVRLESGWELPAISDDAKLATYLEKGDPANRQAVFDSLNAIALPPVIGDNQSQMQDIIGELLNEAAAGRISVADALAQAEERINALLG
ncbi:MAG: sugar ABC transporter substrate-binding protein [Actinomycetes bacterium]